MTINAIDATTRISGRTLMPSVSSSKNLSSPALAAGIGPDFSFFFLLTNIPLVSKLSYDFLHY
jgi:hypothetical protein